MKNYHLVIPNDLHHRVKVYAAQQGVTIKDLIVNLLEKELTLAKGQDHENHRLSD